MICRIKMYSIYIYYSVPVLSDHFRLEVLWFPIAQRAWYMDVPQRSGGCCSIE